MGCNTTQLHHSVRTRPDSQDFLSAARWAMLRAESAVRIFPRVTLTRQGATLG